MILKIITDKYTFFLGGITSLKFRMYFILTAHLNSGAKLLLEIVIFTHIFPY